MNNHIKFTRPFDVSDEETTRTVDLHLHDDCFEVVGDDWVQTIYSDEDKPLDRLYNDYVEDLNGYGFAVFSGETNEAKSAVLTDYDKYISSVITELGNSNDEIHQSLAEEKISALLAVAEKCNLYSKEGYTPKLVMAICRKKAEFIKTASAKTALKEIMKLSDVRYNGNEFVPANKYCIAEEEMIMWSITSLRGPLPADEMKRYEKLFKDIFPENADIFGEEPISKKEEDSKTMENENGTIVAEFTDEVPEETLDYAEESPESAEKTADEYIPETVESIKEEISAPVAATSAIVTDSVEIIRQATEKLEKEANTSGGQNVPAIPIYNYLKKVCEAEITFAALVSQEHKTLLKCFNYVYEQVKKTIVDQTGTQTVWVSDDATYKMAEDYYRLDDAEIERKKEEEKKAREAEQKAAAEKRKAEQVKREAERKNKNAGKPTGGDSPTNNDSPVTSNTKVQKKEGEQLSLFGFEEEESA